MFKRGVSPVIATVLLLVLTVVLAGIIYSFVIPFVNEQLGNSKACLNVLDGVEFGNSPFNCYDTATTTSTYETGFSVKIKKESVVGFRVSLIDAQQNSYPKTFSPGQLTDAAIRAAGSGSSGYGQTLTLPSTGGQRTYVTNNRYSSAEISPIAESGDICAVSDVVTFVPCTEDVIL